MPPYGPPPDPRQVEVAAGLSAAPGAWAFSLLLGALCLGAAHLDRGRPARAGLWAIAGVVFWCTAPAVGMIPGAVWGAFPTIDKAGSLHFYQLGAHFSSWDTSAAATQLIGVSMGHLWVTALFDVVLAPFAAMNAQGLANLVLGWWLATRLGVAVGAPERWARVAGFPMGMGLHLFRDLNWYTIEKSGTWPLTLFVLALVRAGQGSVPWLVAAPLLYAWAFYYNAYWGVLGALVGAVAFVAGPARVRVAAVVAGLGGLPFLALQLPALDNAQLPAPDAFAERAALDVFAPLGGGGFGPNWNRLELWCALDPVTTLAALVSLVGALFTLREPTSRRTLALAAGCAAVAVLAMGPATPVWSAFAALPGRWRFAKPETFFHLVVLGLVVLAARRAPRSPRVPLVVLGVQLVAWALLVRAHPVYPGWSAP